MAGARCDYRHRTAVEVTDEFTTVAHQADRCREVGATHHCQVEPAGEPAGASVQYNRPNRVVSFGVVERCVQGGNDPG